MSKFLIGPNGRLVLVGGRPLSVNPGTAPTTTTTGIALVPNFTTNSLAKFNVQTTAASNDTVADVPVVFTFTGGAPDAVHARVVGVNDVEIVPWTDISASVSVGADGNGIGYLPNVPPGAKYRRQVRVGTSSALTSADTKTFNVGQNFMGMGQSNMVNTIHGYGFEYVPGVTPTINEDNYFKTKTAGAYFSLSGFTIAGADGGSGSVNIVNPGPYAILRKVGDSLKRTYGRDVGACFIPMAINGQPITTFTTPGNAGNAILTNTGVTKGTVGLSSPLHMVRGDYRAVAFHQGETETSSMTRATRMEALKKFCQMHLDQVAKFGRPPEKFTFLFAVMGVYGPGTIPHAEVLRGAVLDLIEYGKPLGWDVRIGWSCIDLDPVNVGQTLHFDEMDARISNLRLTQAFQNAVDPVGTPHGARGPRLTGAITRAGDDITLIVEHEGGAALSAKSPANPITGWYANTARDFSGTELNVSNVTILSPTQIRVTVSGAPSTFYIKHCGHKLGSALSEHPDVTNLVYDDFTYPTGAHPSEQFTGLPLLPTPDAIKVG